MILVGRYFSPFTRRVAITCRLYGLDYEHRPITAWGDLETVQSFNPVGRVPSLILDDGEVLFESAAIIDHLDEVAGPEKALTPPRGPERRRILRLIALVTGTLEKAVAVIYERNQKPPEKHHQPWIDRCLGQAAAGLAALEAAVPEDGWLGGKRPSQADVAVGVLYDFLRRAVPELLPEGRYPKLADLAERCFALPAFQETQPEV